MIAAGMSPQEKKNLSPAEELHHISEQLDELIQFIKDSPFDKTERTDVRPPSANSEVMTVKEAAAMMRISLPKMYEFARSGKVRTLEFGRRILISRSSLLALLQEGE